MIIRVQKEVIYYDINDNDELKDNYTVYISGTQYFDGMETCEENAIQKAFEKKRSLEC